MFFKKFQNLAYVFTTICLLSRNSVHIHVLVVIVTIDNIMFERHKRILSFTQRGISLLITFFAALRVFTHP